jgi:hypothetical protein
MPQRQVVLGGNLRSVRSIGRSGSGMRLKEHQLEEMILLVRVARSIGCVVHGATGRSLMRVGSIRVHAFPPVFE